MPTATLSTCVLILCTRRCKILSALRNHSNPSWDFCTSEHSSGKCGCNLDKCPQAPHNCFVKPTALPFAKLLTQAADRVYVEPVWLGDQMCAEPLHTMHLLSTMPEVFGPLQAFAHPDERRERVNHLLTAARAFAICQRKLDVEPAQAELGLTDSVHEG